MEDEAGTHVGTSRSGPFPRKSHKVDGVAKTKVTLAEISKLGQALEELFLWPLLPPAGWSMPAPSPSEGLGLTLGVTGLMNMGTDGPSGSLG